MSYCRDPYIFNHGEYTYMDGVEVDDNVLDVFLYVLSEKRKDELQRRIDNGKKIYEENKLKPSNGSLTLEQLKTRDKEPVWIESLPRWLKVDNECSEMMAWRILKLINNHIYPDIMDFPLMWTEDNYNIYWTAFSEKPFYRE
jgi:hypothetical protein